jgi:hypothetical protein
MALFNGVGSTNGLYHWIQELNGSIRTIRPHKTTVIWCSGTGDETSTLPSETDMWLAGGNGNLASPIDLGDFEYIPVVFTEPLFTLGAAHAVGYAQARYVVLGLEDDTDLILMGSSEGAAVMADIYDDLRTGDLSGRTGDLLGAVSIASPRRGTNRTFTDPVYGLHPNPLVNSSGMSENPLVGTEDKYWEFALANDPVTCLLNTSDHTEQAYWSRQFYACVSLNNDVATVSAQAAAEGPEENSACSLAWWELLSMAFGGTGHGQYGSTKPFPADTRNWYQVGVDYINSLAPVMSPDPELHRIEAVDHIVSSAQTITAGADVMWRNLPTFSGPAIRICLDVYDASDDFVSTVYSPNTTISNSNNGPYQRITGNFSMPSNAAYARLVYEVAEEVLTTGFVRFKSPSVTGSSGLRPGGGPGASGTGGGPGPTPPGSGASEPPPPPPVDVPPEEFYSSRIPAPLLELKEVLLHEPDTLSRAQAADRIADYTEYNHDKTWIVTVHDLLWRPIGELGDDLIELIGTDPRNNVPTATLKIKGGSQHIEAFKACERTLVGITIETGGLRQAFYVDTFDWEYSKAEWMGTAHLRGIWDVLSFLIIWPNFLFPIQVQIPSHAIFIGPLVSCINLMVAECAFRIQTGLWEFVNNALSLNPDIRAWFGTLLQSNGNFFDTLKTPVYVSAINPFFDSSPLIARTVRMESCAQVIQDVTRAYGVDVRVDLWLPGDEQPDEWTKTFTFLQLNQPTYVVKAVDRSQIEGPTKTILDSVLRTVVDFLGSFFGDIGPLVQSVPGMTGVFESPLLGINFVPPWAVIVAPDIGQKGSVDACKLSYHTPKGWQHIIGGRSPKWLNDLMNALFGWLLDAISILIGIIGIPSDLLSGLLNNAFLAFQLIEHYGRRNQVGPYHPGIEVMHATPTAPYNIETMFGFINALWDSRGYVSGQFSFRDGGVYKYGKDIFRGGLVSLVYDNRTKLFTDYVELVLYRYTPTERDIMVQVGDGKAEESPLAKHQRFITASFEAINVVTLAPQS